MAGLVLFIKKMTKIVRLCANIFENWGSSGSQTFMSENFLSHKIIHYFCKINNFFMKKNCIFFEPFC